MVRDCIKFFIAELVRFANNQGGYTGIWRMRLWNEIEKYNPILIEGYGFIPADYVDEKVYCLFDKYNYSPPFYKEKDKIVYIGEPNRLLDYDKKYRLLKIHEGKYIVEAEGKQVVELDPKECLFITPLTEYIKSKDATRLYKTKAPINWEGDIVTKKVLDVIDAWA